ncbi:glycerol-3-phosphate acyltransferase [Aliishimia ponticola]|uniref:Glycerol-3-phosphate acyltransferase n=1 Tax=Aliishimia ponticola TaxID=2499833 RepID=A0A4S4NDA2_9RHOB|nr:1-acyl-sn-glycerol-3-phosphate acyltransferase [Aliishimia ponticola]THH36011.1 glycerol-3-phosphate acyltransferase [Aliishimia ponticola]
MSQTVELPIWLFVLIVVFAAVTFASHFLFPSVRWFLRRRLERAVARLNQRLTRPIEPFKLVARHDMIQRLIYDPEVTRAIVEYARKSSVREDVAFEKARSYAREIVPSFSAFAYFGLGIRLARWLANALYTVRCGPRNDDIIANIPTDATAVFIMNHRSNMDYVLVTYLAGRASALSYAVGEWARVWPLSRLIKSMGAHFIRRKSRGQLYRKVLARYVQMATEGGVTQAIFPEGGLSLDGNLAPPKLGLLSYVVEAGRESDRDVVFVPVAINYDRILEDRVLMAAHQRGDRRFGARISVVVGFILQKLWLRVRGKFLRFGSAAVVFGEPLSLQSFDADAPVEALAQDLMTRIEAAMPRLAVPLLSKRLLEQGAPTSRTALMMQAAQDMEAAPERYLLNPSENPMQVLDAALDQMIARGFVTVDADRVTICEGERDALRFYANSTEQSERTYSAAAK